ncbi:hypothetical protein KCU75_g57, partial [Aureobasidium melanogenum]
LRDLLVVCSGTAEIGVQGCEVVDCSKLVNDAMTVNTWAQYLVKLSHLEEVKVVTRFPQSILDVEFQHTLGTSGELNLTLVGRDSLGTSVGVVLTVVRALSNMVIETLAARRSSQRQSVKKSTLLKPFSGNQAERTKPLSAMLGSVSMLKAGPSLSSAWRDGDEKSEPTGLIGDADELLARARRRAGVGPLLED